MPPPLSSSVSPLSRPSLILTSSVCLYANLCALLFELTLPFFLADATIEIAIWSNIEVGLGITAGSLATLRPLLRHWMGSTNDASYPLGTPSPFPGRSGSRLPGASGRDRAYPLGSMDDSNRLRPDKLALTVTTVQTQHDPEDRWPVLPDGNSSEERLTNDHQRNGKGNGKGNGNRTPTRSSAERNGMGSGFGGIHQVIEVTQTSTDLRSTSVKEHV